MPIIKNHIDFGQDFTMLPNDWVRDARLSHRARGVLAVVMSHRDGWETSITHLVREGKEGRNAIYTAVDELVAHGYLERVEVRSATGKFDGVNYEVRNPHPGNQQPLPKKPYTDNPHAGKPYTDNPQQENNNLKKTRDKENQIEEQGATSTPAKKESKPLHQEITTWVYDQTKGGINFAATMGVIKHHLKQGRQPKDVANACLAVYKMGKPITNQTLGQYMDGHLNKPAFHKTQQKRQAEQFEVINNLAQHYPLGEETEYEPY